MKKAISLLLALVLCLSLCACSCNCGCPYCCGGNDNATPNTAPATTIPEATKSQEETLKELLTSTTWTRTLDNKKSKVTFFDDGSGVIEGTYDDGRPYSSGITWDIKGGKLVFSFKTGWTGMLTYVEEKGYYEDDTGNTIVPNN